MTLGVKTRCDASKMEIVERFLAIVFWRVFRMTLRLAMLLLVIASIWLLCLFFVSFFLFLALLLIILYFYK